MNLSSARHKLGVIRRAARHPSCRSPKMDLLLAALLLVMQASDPRSGRSTMSTPREPTAVDAQTPRVQDTEAQMLLRLEDDWALGLTHRDAALFRRLLGDGFGTLKTIGQWGATASCAM